MKKNEDGKLLLGVFHPQDIKEWALLFYIYIVTRGKKKNLSQILVLKQKFSNCPKTSDIFQQTQEGQMLHCCN